MTDRRAAAAETPAETIARAARQMRSDANGFRPGDREEQFRLTTAAWLESWAEIEIALDGPYLEDLQHGLKIARAYLGGVDG
jgi:hypothetical protein